MSRRKNVVLEDEKRFEECGECKFYKPRHTARACRNCDIGENFEATIKELTAFGDGFYPDGHMDFDDE